MSLWVSGGGSVGAAVNFVTRSGILSFSKHTSLSGDHVRICRPSSNSQPKKKRIRLEACDRCSISCSSRREVDETYCHRERLGTGPDPISTAVDRRHCSSSSSSPRRRHSDLSEPPGTGHAASSGRQRGAPAATARAFQPPRDARLDRSRPANPFSSGRSDVGT